MSECKCGPWNPNREELDALGGLVGLPAGTESEEVRLELAGSIKRDHPIWGTPGQGNPLHGIMGSISLPDEDTIRTWALCEK